MPSYSQYKRQMIVLDADDIQWITVRGNHIPIKEGQTKEEAVKSFLEKKGGEERKLSNGGSTVGLTEKEHNNIEEHNNKVKEISKSEKEAGKNISNASESQKNESILKNAEKIYGKNSPEAKKAQELYGNKETKPSMKEKMQKIIQQNGKVYGWETEGLEKFAENVEGKSREQLEELHKAYKERVAKLGMWVDTPTKLQEQFLGEVLKEMPEKKANEFVNGNSENKNIATKANIPVAKVNPNKWGNSWSKRANKPVTLGEAAKSAVQTSYSLNKKAKQEANYTALEIAYNDVAFNKSPDKNKADMLKAISNSGAENIDYMKQTISNMPETAFESHNAFRKGLKDTSKWHIDWFKRANKPVELGKSAQTATKIVEKTKELKKLDKKA